jgi:hypothetical protein
MIALANSSRLWLEADCIARNFAKADAPVNHRAKILIPHSSRHPPKSAAQLLLPCSKSPAKASAIPQKNIPVFHSRPRSD